MFKGILLGAAAALLIISSASADDAATKDKAKQFAATEIKKWVSDPDIVAAINAANTERAGYDQAKIDEMDKQWKAEVGATAHPLVDQIAADPSSAKLKVICGSNDRARSLPNGRERHECRNVRSDQRFLAGRRSEVAEDILGRPGGDFRR
jgi:hypothetical protein